MAETLLIVFVVLVVLGMPVAIALGVGTLAAATLYPALNPIIIPSRFVGLLSDSFLLLSAPLFILAGNIAARGGVARAIIDLAHALHARQRKNDLRAGGRRDLAADEPGVAALGYDADFQFVSDSQHARHFLRRPGSYHQHGATGIEIAPFVQVGTL